MGPQGGYFLRLESFAGLDLPGLARQALAIEGVPSDGVSLRVSAHRKRRVVHVTLEASPQPAPPLAGACRARWFSEHPTLARLLSCQVEGAVQSYALEPDRFEEVFTWAAGRRVGGERLEYATVELSAEAEADDQAFARLQQAWPLGHLAYVFGLPRAGLLELTRSPGEVFSLGEERGGERLEGLLPAGGHAQAPDASR